MVTTTERQEQRRELVAQGYSWDFIDTWQPKITLYRHKPGKNDVGVLVFPVGTAMKGLPGNPSHVIKKARDGMLPYPPTDTCECRWCVESRTSNVESSNPNAMAKASCKECDYVAEHVRLTNATASLRKHEQDKHS
jgi:hypothetical protein